MKPSYRLSLFLLVQISVSSARPCGDTVPKHHLSHCITHQSNLSASYTHYKDWRYNGYNNYTFLGRSNFNFDSTSATRELHSRFCYELSYTKFADSAWFKNTDCIDLGFEWQKKEGKTLQRCFSFYFSSQLLSVYEKTAGDPGKDQKRWISGFGNPMNIELGYGSTLRFWKNCRINLCYVTLKTSTSPLLEKTAPRENEMVCKNALIRSEYGFGLQVFIRKDLGSKIRWENNSRCFANAIHRSKFDFDFRNRIVFKLIKCLSLIIDNRIRYTPYPPYKFQFRNELALSFTFEKM